MNSNFRFTIFDPRLLSRSRRPTAIGARPSAARSKVENPKSKIRGSVIVIVMITMIFAATALVVFMDKASNDLLVEQRDAEARRLRREAYSALEVTLAVLEDFRQVNNGLHSPAEGWNDPLTFASYTPTEDRTVDIAFEDESGKISLPRATAQTLTNLFKNWEIQDTDAEALADALMGWMRANHVYSNGFTPDYDQGKLPYEEPGRPIRSYEELAAIDKVRDTFFDADGRPNDLWLRFVDSVSLLDFQRASLNGAKPDTLAALGQFDEGAQKNVHDYLRGEGAFQAQGPGYFQNVGDVAPIAGSPGELGGFGTAISALRIFVTVHDGQTQFRLAAVVAPPNGATTVQATATQQRTQTGANANPNAARNATPGATATPGRTGGANVGNTNLRYPFTVLEIRENDDIPPPPPPPPTDQSV
jgi:general secretion pathway protein K